MITDIIINFLLLILKALLSPLLLLPDVSLNQEILDAITETGQNLNYISQIFPVYDLLAAFGIFLAFEVLLNSYKVIRWIYQKIPGIN